MFDIHYHLLFDVDDGPKTLEASLALAEASIAEGVTHIVATPHANDHYAFNPELNRQRLEVLKGHLAGRLTLGLGCDFHLSWENVERLRKDPTRYTINGTQYLLVEFAESAISSTMTETFYDMQVNGVTPIITHPERNPILVANPRRMAPWIQGGCLVQVTAASLHGRFGRRAQVMARDLIGRNWVHIIASDAHSIEGRPPAMADAYRTIKHEFNQEMADRLCVHNPGDVFRGEVLGPQPEPVGIYDQMKPVKRGFFTRLFRG